jgi:hypothetical protein
LQQQHFPMCLVHHFFVELCVQKVKKNNEETQGCSKMSKPQSTVKIEFQLQTQPSWSTWINGWFRCDWSSHVLHHKNLKSFEWSRLSLTKSNCRNL